MVLAIPFVEVLQPRAREGTPLEQALLKKDVSSAEYLVKAGADPYQYWNVQHKSPMAFLIKEGNLETVQRLVEAGANADEALRIATRLKAQAISAMLVTAGAKIVKEKSGDNERHEDRLPDRVELNPKRQRTGSDSTGRRSVQELYGG